MRSRVPLFAFILVASAPLFVLSPARATDIMNSFCCTPGATASITRKGDGDPCFDNQGHLTAAIKAMAENDDYGYRNATRYAVALKAGQRVRWLENASNWTGGAIRVRILTGIDAGVACWIPGAFDDVVKSVRGE